MPDLTIIDTNIGNISRYGFCGYKNSKKPAYPEKLNWLKERYSEGLKLKIIVAEKDSSQGMIEYIPGNYCWRPVEAVDYMFIHCLFAGFKSIYKNRGYATQLIAACEKDAKR